MTTTASPEAMRMPASVAAGWPKRRDRRSILTARVEEPDLADAVLGRVGAGVEAEDDLVVDLGRHERRPQALVERADVVLLVEARDHDRDQRAGSRGLARGVGAEDPEVEEREA